MSADESAVKGSIQNRQVDFTVTHWSVVLQAGRGASDAGRVALEQLCGRYWYPLYVYVRRRGHGPDEAQDLTQEFFARLLERNDLAQADPAKGRFRSFLLGAMNHFLANEWRKAQTAKRGAGQAPISLDEETAEGRYVCEPATAATPESLYERRWALMLFESALDRLREEWSLPTKARQFEQLKQFLSSDADEGEYARVAEQLELKPGAVAVAVHRLRQRCRELVREEIAQTVTSPAALEEELRHLLAMLS
jgi:RNA polymerase sigma-70 factor (ECF subfamily)